MYTLIKVGRLTGVVKPLPDKILKEMMLSLIFLISLEVFAGISMLGGGDYLIKIPVLFMLLPALMDLRGDVMGPYGFRLLNSLHLGTNEPRFATKYNLLNSLLAVSLMIISTFFVVAAVSVLAYVVGVALGDLEVLTSLSLVSTVITTLIMMPILIIFTNTLYIKGYNVENFLPSLITGSMDALTPSVLFGSVFLIRSMSRVGRLVLIASVGVAAIIGVFLIYREKHLELIKDFKENLTTSVIVATISGVGGSFFSRNPTVVVGSGFVAFIPALNSLMGSAQGILAGKLSVDIHMTGIVEKKVFWSYFRKVLTASETAVIFLALIFAVISILPVLPPISGVSVATSFLVVAVMVSLLSFVVEWLTKTSFRLGLNPDNVVFPFITSLSDLFTPITSYGILYSLVLVLGIV